MCHYLLFIIQTDPPISVFHMIYSNSILEILVKFSIYLNL